MVVANSDWYPNRMPDQSIMYSNVETKIEGYLNILPITQEQVDEILSICGQWLAVYNYVNTSQATSEGLTEWRKSAFTGNPMGTPLPAAPKFESFILGTGWTIGIVTRFRELVAMIKECDGYTEAIGEDLMTVATKSEPIAPGLITAELKVSTSIPYTINFAGSMQGADAIKIEYQRKGSDDWVTIGYFTHLPAFAVVTPGTPGTAETGRVRGQLYKKNVPYGNMSPEYLVTLS